jgi:DNA N-6-adenine-methyltransferase (Dam)
MAENDECYTPKEWIDRARLVLGGRIDVDPASNERAQEIVQARRYYTAERSSLRRQVLWRGRVWMNPPYSYPDPFVEKLVEQYHQRFTVQAIALMNARTGAAWFQLLGRYAWRCEKRKRIKFWGPGVESKKKRATKKGKKGGGNGFNDNVFFYLGDNPARFASVFADVGSIVAPHGLTVTETVTGRRPIERACRVCGRSLDGYRAHAQTCGDACRMRLSRARAG